MKQNPATDFPSQPSPNLQALGGVLLGIALLWVPVLALHLTPALFAALITFGSTRALAERLRHWRLARRSAEGWALLCILLLLGAGIAGLVEFAAQTRASLPKLLQQMALVLEQLRTALPVTMAEHLPVSLDALREAAAQWLRAHAGQVQLWGGHTLRGLGYVIAGVVIGALAAMQLPIQAPGPGQAMPLAVTLRQRFDELVQSFTNVVFAQLRIAAINAALTALFLLGILPLLGRPLPMAGTLVAVTFFAGLLPVVGNLISNTVIVIIASSNSLLDAGLCLAWLVAIHKLEYFLNAHIIGTRIRAHAWELLIVMLVMEALFGLAGLLSAPIVYAQLKCRLHAQGWLD